MDFRDISTHSTGTHDDDLLRNGIYARSRKLNRYLPSTRLARGTGEPSNLILKSLPAETYALLEPYMKSVNMTKEQFLYQEGGRLDFLYFPVTAVVSEFKILEDGRMVEIAVTGREGAIG